ncbi:MAG TPA: hypothetical protein PKJ33_02760 [Alphaproteobacteria bacterium]|nr:hypothetical protein [Alphaproteobacteria bacterium]
MKLKANIVAQKLLNLYRQQHVIFGGWKSVNQIFVKEATPDVISEIKMLPNGRLLAQHIENLRSGKTPTDSIAPELLPYGGSIAESSVASTSLSETEIAELEDALADFIPNNDGLLKIQSLGAVKKFGNSWQVGIRSAISGNQNLLGKWNDVVKTDRAHYLWKLANDILAAPISERARAQVQAELPDYETYLPMFGDTGKEILSKLRIFVTKS